MADPIVLISSYPPRLCGIATFCEEAREFIQKRHPDRQVLVISHLDGAGDGVFPIIDMTQRGWWRPVAAKVRQLQPFAVHIQHEYGLYEYRDPRGRGDGNEGFLDLLDAIDDFPTVVEPHTVHGRLNDFEADFLFKLSQRADVVLFKCHYQKWRLDWNFHGRDWPTPRNIMVVPHGARPDRRWGVREVPALREELGLNDVPYLSDHLVGLIGWIQSNKRWDILLSMWEEIHDLILERSGGDWDLGIGDLVFYSVLSSHALMLGIGFIDDFGILAPMLFFAAAVTGILIGFRYTIRKLEENVMLPGLPIPILLSMTLVALVYTVLIIIYP